MIAAFHQRVYEAPRGGCMGHSPAAKDGPADFVELMIRLVVAFQVSGETIKVNLIFGPYYLGDGVIMEAVPKVLDPTGIQEVVDGLVGQLTHSRQLLVEKFMELDRSVAEYLSAVLPK